MKLNPKVIALMTLLAAGAAGAQTASVDRTGNLTNANTSITNTATATYDVPNGTGGFTSTSTDSNQVKTTVLPKYAFDVTYTTGADTDLTDNTAGAPTSYTKTGVVPGTNVVFPYVAVNNGNAIQTITLGSDATAGVSNIKYFLANPDTNADGIVSAAELTAAQAIAGNDVTSTGVTVAPSGDDPTTTGTVETNSGMVNFWMVYTATGAAGATVGATPIGTGQAWDGTNNATGVVEQKDAAAPAYDDLWWQYNKVVIITPGLTNDPSNTPTAGGVDTPPTGGTNVPGYTDPTGTVIAISGDEQFAYPKADTNLTNDTVVFTNTVTNTSPVADTVTLSITPRTGTYSPDGGTTNYTYTQTVTPTATPGVYTVVETYKDSGGTTVSTTTATVTISNVNPTAPANGTVNYTVTVNYPDQDSLPNTYPIHVAVGVDSGNDTDTTPNDTTYDTILPPAMQFADTTSGVLGATDTPVQKTGTAGTTVSFPMDVANTGEYPDTYTLKGYTVVTLQDGSKQIVPVVYTSAGTTLTPTATTFLVDLNGDGDTLDPGESVSGFTYTTSTVASNSEVLVQATVALPSNVAATNGTNYVLNQNATATYSGISLSDTNDNIVVTAAGTLAIAKFTSQSPVTAGSITVNGISNPANYTNTDTSYLPGVQYSYKIIAKNTYNAQIMKFKLSDTLNSNLNFVSLVGSITGNTVSGSGDTSGTTVIYSTDGTTWTITAPTGSPTNLYVAVDDPTQAGNQPGALDPNAQLDMTITVTIK